MTRLFRYFDKKEVAEFARAATRAVLTSIALIACLTAAATAQRQNTHYVYQFEGSSVGAKTTRAQNACLPDTSVPCILIFEPNLAVFTEGTMPAICDQCVWVRYDRAGVVDISNLGTARNAVAYPGANACAQIAAAVADCPTAGCTVDARGIEGAQTCGATVTLDRSLELLLGSMVLSGTANPFFDITEHGVTIRGNCVAVGTDRAIFATPTNCTVLQLTGTSGNVIRAATAGTNDFLAGVRIENLTLMGNRGVGGATAGTGILLQGGDSTTGLEHFYIAGVNAREFYEYGLRIVDNVFQGTVAFSHFVENRLDGVILDDTGGSGGISSVHFFAVNSTENDRDGYRTVLGVLSPITWHGSYSTRNDGHCWNILGGQATIIGGAAESCLGDGIRTDRPSTTVYSVSTPGNGGYGINALANADPITIVDLQDQNSTSGDANITAGVGAALFLNPHANASITGTHAVLRGNLMALNGVAQANLGTPANGTIRFCNDCTIANPCAGGGTGAMAKRLNGVWVCN